MFLTEVKNGANTVVGAKQTLKAIVKNKAKSKVKKSEKNPCVLDRIWLK